MKVRAAILDEMALPRPYATSRPLRVEHIDLLSPAATEVIVEIVAAGLCHSDLSTIDATRPWPVPIVLGHEASGVVREVGTDVPDLRPGDPVVFSFVPSCRHCGPCLAERP